MVDSAEFAGSAASAHRSRASTTVDRWWSFGLGGLTFLGALLLFQVQPMIGKAVVPWYGGAAAAWTVTMLFFQTALVGGYALVYLTTRFCSAQVRTIGFAVGASAVALLLPVLPDDHWKPEGGDAPIAHLLAMLAACVGAPYVVLAMTGPLVQEWHHRVFPDRSPYRLYALSNTGSLLGLLAYPFVLEPSFDLSRQSQLWSIGYGAFALSGVVLAATMPRRVPPRESTFQVSHGMPAVAAPPSWKDPAGWLAAAAGGSTMLLVVTNHLCEDVPAMPFLWIGPMVVYLLTFILCFERPAWYRRTLWSIAAVVLVPAACLKIESFGLQVAANLGMLAAVCMLCHGELARSKPEPRRLTAYYLLIAVGGAAGGLFVGVAAPLTFARYWEWMIATCGALMFGIVLLLRTAASRFGGRTFRLVGLAAMLGGAALLVHLHRAQFNPFEIDVARNFYGVVYVDAALDEATSAPLWVAMRSGNTIHGSQFFENDRRRRPTTYYGPTSGVGRLLLAGLDGAGRRIGVVGLGGGTLAAYGRVGDELRFYELNPAVVRFADEYFSYRRDTPARSEVVVGDARLALEEESPQEFDVLVLDAFSSDSVPTHLLTLEAFAVYLRHLKPQGVVAAHVSNQHLFLAPVVAGAARHHGLSAGAVYDPDVPEQFVRASLWVLLTRDPDSTVWRRLSAAGMSSLGDPAHDRPWTDRYSNLLPLLK